MISKKVLDFGVWGLETTFGLWDQKIYKVARLHVQDDEHNM